MTKVPCVTLNERKANIVVDEKRRIEVDDLYKINTVEDPRISPDGQWIAGCA
jgi:hypothetical protein